MALANTTMHDLTDHDVVEDAAWALHQAELGGGGDAAMAAWATTWGRAAIEALRQRVDGGDGR